MDLREKFEARTCQVNRCKISESISEDDFEKLKNELNSKKQEINRIFKENENSWRDHTKRMHPLRKIAKMFNNRNFQSSQAFSKFFEILTRFHQIIPSTSKSLKSFHLCEGPGHFIAALDLYSKSFWPNFKWEWMANTLDPYFENIKSCDKFLDDTFIFNHYNQWIRGAEGDGDIFKLSSEYLHNSNLNSQFDLVTADGSFYVQNNPGEQEILVFPLIKKEIDVARTILKPGGTLVLKLFTIFEKDTRNLIKETSQYFENCIFFKPMCSKPGNSEKYAIFLNYNPDSFNDLELCDAEILEIENKFTSLQISAISKNIETFGTEKTDLEILENEVLVNEYLSEIEFYSLKISKRSKNLEPCNSTPWKQMFGNNLVDRISKIQNFDATILTYLDSDHLIVEVPEFCFELGNFEVSNSKIQNHHSLFINPIILHCLENSQQFKYLDIFQNCSKSSGKSQEFWKSDSELSVALDKLDSMKDITFLLEKIKQENIEKIVFTWLDSTTINLILSRFSASIFGLFNQLYSNFDFVENQLIFTGYNSKFAPVIEKINKSTSEIESNLRNFLSLQSLASLHSTIFNFNLAQLQKIKITYRS